MICSALFRTPVKMMDILSNGQAVIDWKYLLSCFPTSRFHVQQRFQDVTLIKKACQHQQLSQEVFLILDQRAVGAAQRQKQEETFITGSTVKLGKNCTILKGSVPRWCHVHPKGTIQVYFSIKTFPSGLQNLKMGAKVAGSGNSIIKSSGIKPRNQFRF